MTRPNKSISLSTKALLRYHVVSLVHARLLAGVPLAMAVRQVADMDHPGASGELRRVSKRSIYRWLARYKRGGAAELTEQARKAKRTSRVLDEKLLEYLFAERSYDPEASIPELIRRAQKCGHIESTSEIDRTTVYRAFVRRNVPTGRRTKQRGRDMRRFAYAHRMEMVLADGKHFRAGAQRLRRVAYFFLDDATRLGLHVVVGTSESAALFLPALHHVLRSYGRMGILYLDGGPGFVANAVAEVCSRLKICLLHGESRYPEGHGKIERFNRTVKASVLRALDGRPDVDPSCEALELRLAHWLRETYNHTAHESLVVRS